MILDIICNCEQLFNEMFEQTKMEHRVKQKTEALICSNAYETSLASITEVPCKRGIAMAVDLYLTLRLHYKLKFFNRSLSNFGKRRKNRKALKVMHS